jgi:hypothetical protein
MTAPWTPDDAGCAALEAHPDCAYAEVTRDEDGPARGWVVCLWETLRQCQDGRIPTYRECYPAPPDGH